MDFCKSAFFGKCECFCKILLRFARKSRNYIGSDSGIGEIFSYKLNLFIVFIGGVSYTLTWNLEVTSGDAGTVKIGEVNAEGRVPVTIDFDYEDSEGDAHTTTEKINIPVVEKTDLSIDNINGPYEMYVGNTGYISFEYYNKGKATISNLSVTIEGDYSPVNATNYIGNVEAGNGSYSEIEVRADVDGQAKGTLIFSFEDSSGNVKTIKRAVEGMVFGEMPTFEPDPGMMDMPIIEPEVEQLEWWKLLFIGLGTFLVTMFIIRFITIKIMMKKLEDEI